MVVFFFLYLIAAVFVGYVGRDSRLGFWGVVVVSFLFTPLLTFVILILFGRKGTFQGA